VFARPLAVIALGAILLAAGLVPIAVSLPPVRTTAGSGGLFASDGIPISAGALLRPMPSGTPVQVSLTLQPSSASGLATFDSAVSDPSSPQYRQFLTESQFEARFSPSASNVSSVVSYFAGFGARAVTVTPDRLGVSFLISAGAAGRAFGTGLVEAAGPGGEPLRTTATLPTLPSGVAARLAAVSGLSGALRPASASLLGPLTVGRPGPSVSPDAFLNGSGIASGSQWFVGSDFVGAYHEGSLFPGSSASYPNATFPTREAVATLLMSSYNDSTGQNLPPWDPTQVDSYFNDTLAPSWPHPVVQGVPVGILNVTPPAPGSLGFQNDTSLNEEENSLDLEMAGSMAPGAEIVNFYFAASLFLNGSASTTYQTIADDFGSTLSSALSHNYSPRRLASVSGSFGLPDLNDSLWNTELAHAAAVGVTVVAASGDQANAPDSVSGRDAGPGPTWPATAAFNDSGTIAVGGVTLAASGAATGTFDGVGSPSVSYDASVNGIAGQQAWYDTLAGSGNYSGTEGGISVAFPEPYWQFESAAQPPISGAAGTQGVSALGRAEPDVAFPANDTIAFVRTAAGGAVETGLLEGTSVAAPVLAGLIAEWAAVDGHPFGYLDPELYRIGSYYAANPGSGNPFLDVSSGGNYEFVAAGGWDATTGWGGMDAVKFLVADANASIRDFVYTGPTPGLPPASSQGSPNLLLAIPIGVALAGVIVVWIALERRTPTVIGGPPAPKTPPPGAPEGTWFACPYCGAARPSDPVRCPGCGRF
jgi:subtilase family serine protease